jgi:RNA recognition motif-containing protein
MTDPEPRSPPVVPPPAAEEWSRAVTVYVSNLPYSETEQTVRALFEPFGRVLKALMKRDRWSLEFQGTAFVAMDSRDAATAAIKALNGAEYRGVRLRVEPAVRPYDPNYRRSREPRSPPRRQSPPRRSPPRYGHDFDRERLFKRRDDPSMYDYRDRDRAISDARRAPERYRYREDDFDRYRYREGDFDRYRYREDDFGRYRYREDDFDRYRDREGDFDR